VARRQANLARDTWQEKKVQEVHKTVEGTLRGEAVSCRDVSCLPGLAFQIEGKAKTPNAVSKNKGAVQPERRCDNSA